MIELKREAIALIENIPDGRTDILADIIKVIRDRLADDSQDEIYSQAEQDLALMEDIESWTREGGDKLG